MSPASHVRYQTETPPFVAFVNYDAPASHVGDAILTGLGATVRPIVRRFKAFRVKIREAQAARTLARLDDRTLEDIGLRRSQIGHVARLVAENPGVDYRLWCR